MIEVRQAGLCDLVMDLGRPGHGAQGVPAGGAADPAALAAANRLVGNDPDAAALEIVLAGPDLAFPAGAVAALAGARFDAARSSGVPVAWNETLVLAAGETLTLGAAVAGARCWLAVRGGLAVDPVLGSRSTFLPGGWGGLAGRALQSGDRLPVGPVTGEVRLLRAQAPAIKREAPLRVVAGPQIGGFDDAGLAAFFGGSFRVDPASDRRGLRLTGPRVRHAQPELPSQGVLPGAIQVPPDGQPIVLGWDGPVTGGYPVIATVIGVDLPRLAQLRPGDAVRFVTVELETARGLATQDPWRIEELG
ncbi:MAG: biotin-dependent carboxyltransferase family protein [Gammaproteobacteria bacterium]